MVLILGMVILGMTAVVGFGSQALDATEQRSEVANAEQAMAQFDSKAAQVALGDSTVQSVPFGQPDSSYHVIGAGTASSEEKKGHITITHSNFDGELTDDGDSIDDDGDDDHEIYNEDIGTVVSENRGTTIAYQGGGVWRRDENGGSTMISPPEFHYRGGTLTFPIVQVLGDSAAAGSSKVTLSKKSTVSKYPKLGSSYPDGSPYDNPVENGEIKIEVQSEYYEAWAEYFRTRTEACVVTSDDTVSEVEQRCNLDSTEFDVDIPTGETTVSVYLIAPGDRGQIDFPGEDHTINIRGVEDHSLTRFDTTLVDGDSDSADFSNLQWSMYAESGDQQFEIHLRRASGNDCSNMVVSATVYYSPADGDSDNKDPYQGWYDDDAFKTECYEAGDGDSDNEFRFVADFIDDEDSDDTVHDTETGNPELKYESLSSSDLMSFKPSSTLIDTANAPKFNHDSVSWEPKSYSAGDSETIDRLINHYISLMDPEVELMTDDKKSDTVNDDASSAYIDYPPSGRVITFLHVTENGIRVRRPRITDALRSGQGWESVDGRYRSWAPPSRTSGLAYEDH